MLKYQKASFPENVSNTFVAHCRYHWRDLFLLQELSIDDANFLIKGDDIRSETEAKACHRRLRAA